MLTQKLMVRLNPWNRYHHENDIEILAVLVRMPDLDVRGACLTLVTDVRFAFALFQQNKM